MKHKTSSTVAKWTSEVSEHTAERHKIQNKLYIFGEGGHINDKFYGIKLNNGSTYISFVPYASQDILVYLQASFLVTFRKSFFDLDEQLVMVDDIHHFLKVTKENEYS